MSKDKINLMVGLEIGTTKVAMLAAKDNVTPGTPPKWEILSAAQAPHKGIHQGLIVDTQEIIFALQKVKSEVELTVGQRIENVLLTVADQTLETVHAKGVVSVKKQIQLRDIESVVKAAKDTAQVRSEREILHAFPQHFRVDGTRHETAPIKVKGTSVEVNALLVTVNRRNLQLAKDCLKAVGLQAAGVVAAPVAAAYAVTQKHDRDHGVAVVDMGGSLTNIAAFKNSHMAYVSTIALGGVNFTQDLAVGLRTPQASAEKIKKTNGAALVDLVSPEEIVEIESLKGEPARPVEARLVSEILEARSEETLGLVLRKLNDEDLLPSLKSGLLLTGGASQLPGLPELGEFTFDIAVRRGEAQGLAGSHILGQSPALAAVLGLLIYSRGNAPAALASASTVKDNTPEFLKTSLVKIKNIIDNIL